MLFILYILYATDIDKYYIGYTGDDIEDRLRRHLSGHVGYTARSKQWKVVHKELFDNKADAMKREREIKGWKSRQRIERLFAKE